MYHPSDRIVHTAAFVILIVEHWLECEIAQIEYNPRILLDVFNNHNFLLNITFDFLLKLMF